MSAKEQPDVAPTLSGYVIAPTFEAVDTAPIIRAAHFDPGPTGGLGVSVADGSFRHILAPAQPPTHLRLFAATMPVGAWPTEEPKDVNARPQPNHTPWAHWAFVPGRVAEVVAVHANSKQVLLTALPIAPSSPRRVMLAREMAQRSAISALAVDSHGEWVGVGQEDGTVTFFILGSVLGELPRFGDERLASEHLDAHDGPVTSLTMLRGSMAEAGVEAALACTSSHDQTLCIWDLRAGMRLHRILTANLSPTTALRLSMLPPGAAATGFELNEPAVLLMAGSADGGVQAWSLEASNTPRLLSTWFHATRSPILALAYVDSGALPEEARVLAVASGGREAAALPGSDGELAEVEEHSCVDWHLLATHSLGAERHDNAPLVSAEFEEGGALVGGATPAGETPRLLVARSVGALRLWELPSPFATEEEDDEDEDEAATEGGGEGVASKEEAEEVEEEVEEEEAALPYASSADDALVMARRPPPQPQPYITGIGDDYDDDDDDTLPRSSVPVATAQSPKKGLLTSKGGAPAPPVPLPPKPAPPKVPDEPRPITGAKFDNPHRVIAIVQRAGWDPKRNAPDGTLDEEDLDELDTDTAGASGSGGGMMMTSTHPLATPTLNSSARLMRESAALEARTFESHVLPQVAEAAATQARREATPLLNTPAKAADRYDALTPLEPTTAPMRQESRRRKEHHAGWHAQRSLEPTLDALFTLEREPEMLDTLAEGAVGLGPTPSFVPASGGGGGGQRAFLGGIPLGGQRAL